MDSVAGAMASQRTAWRSLALAGLGLLALGAGMSLLSHHAEATHYRGGTLYAVPDPAAGPNSVRFEGNLFWRIDDPAHFGWSSPSSCTVGTVFAGAFAINTAID